MTELLINDSLCPVTWRSRPGGFVSLMTLYESNFIRLHQLFGDVAALPDYAVSDRHDDCPLHLRIDERSRYTTTFTLTYKFVENGVEINDPDLQIRVYHDAHLGEALRCARWRRHPVLDSLLNDIHQTVAMRDLDERWRRNMMLNKWLEYCEERGHSFVAP